MSEAPTTQTTNNTPAAVAATSLYPADGGAAAAEAARAAAEGGASTETAPAVAETPPAGTGADSITAGTATDSGTAATGADSVSGAAGQDSLTAPVYQITLPEGFTQDAGLMTEAQTVLAAAGVAPDKAQPLIDLFGKAMKAATDAKTAAVATRDAAWLAETNALPEFTGPTRETSLASIKRLMDEYGTPEAKAALDSSGVGNNPALVKMMHKIASVLTEGTPAPATKPAPNASGKAKPTTIGGSLYPNLAEQA